MSSYIDSDSDRNMSEDPFLFEKDEFAKIGREDPHAVFESEESYRIKRRINSSDDYNIVKPISAAPPNDPPRRTDEVSQDWARAEKICTAGQFQPSQLTMMSNIEGQLDTIVLSRPPVTRFLLLGMGAPHDKDQGSSAVLQYYIARHIICSYINKLSIDYHDFDEFIESHLPEIICDSSRWYESDLRFLKDQFSGALDRCKFLHAPLAHIMQVVDSKNAFVIIIHPDNPVRQIMSQIVLAEEEEMPGAILCAESYCDTPSRDKDVFEPDNATRNVETLFVYYKGMECVGFPETASNRKPWLYVSRELSGQSADSDARQMIRSVPSTTNSPHPLGLIDGGVELPNADISTTGANSEYSDVSNVYYRAELLDTQQEYTDRLYRG